jgi:hypothetical protein
MWFSRFRKNKKDVPSPVTNERREVIFTVDMFKNISTAVFINNNGERFSVQFVGNVLMLRKENGTLSIRNAGKKVWGENSVMIW